MRIPSYMILTDNAATCSRGHDVTNEAAVYKWRTLRLCRSCQRESARKTYWTNRSKATRFDALVRFIDKRSKANHHGVVFTCRMEELRELMGSSDYQPAVG
jgi:hypothetical protein